MVTVVITLFTKGSDSEVVRLSIKAFRQHLSQLGNVLGFSCFPSSPSSSSSSSSSDPSASEPNPQNSTQLSPSTNRSSIFLHRLAIMLAVLVVAVVAEGVAVCGVTSV